MKPLTILISCIALVIVLITVYMLWKKTKTPVKVLPKLYAVSPIQDVVKTPSVVSSTTGKTGIWLRNPGNVNGKNYDNGYTLGESIKYCNVNNSDLAGLEMLNQAGSRGMKFCTPGWHKSGESYDASMYGQGVAGCKTTGQHTGYDGLSAELKMGTFCFGLIPNSPEVAISHTF